MLENTPDMKLYLIYITKDSLKSEMRQKRGTGVDQKSWCDLSNHGTTSLDVMKAKLKYLGFSHLNYTCSNQRTDNSHKGDGVV